jgi:hypothetical protein
MSDPVTEELCTICHRDREAHRTMHHQFQSPGQPGVLVQQSVKAPEAPHSGTNPTVRLPSASDPILRMALIRAGVITVAQLDEVEEELRATGVAGHVPSDPLV